MFESNQSRRVAEDFRVGDWLVQPGLNRISNGNLSEKVEPKVMEVLVCLARQPGETATREQLLETLWGDACVTEDALNRAVSKLRKILGDDPKNPEIIETIPKVGYRLIAVVSQEQRKPAQIKPLRAYIVASLLALSLAVVGWTLWRRFVTNASDASLPAIRVTPLTSFPGMEISHSISPDGNQVAYARKENGKQDWDIYITRVGVETPLHLTGSPAHELSPAWSPDGRTIAFVRRSKDQCGIYSIPALGGGERHLTGCHPESYSDLEWSADGKWLAVTDVTGPRAPHSIFLLSLETLEKRQLTSPPPQTEGDFDLAFSPIENVLAFSRSSALGAADIYFLRLDGRDPQRMTFDNLKVHGLAWAADGRRIIYSSNRGGNFNLWQIATTGGAPERVTLGGRSLEEPSISRSGNRLAYQDWSSDTNIWRLDLFRAGEAAPAAIITSTQWDWNPQFSPDGAHIAFVSDRSGGAEIWISDRDGTQPVQLTSFSGPYVNTPRWSPDSRYLVFNAPVDGNTELYIIGKNGGLPRRLTQSPGEKRAASWSRAGSWIYYSSNRSGDWQVWRTPVEGGEAMQITSRGGFASFESPDGKWLYFTKQAMPGLWRAPAGGGEEALVFAELHPVDWENWVVSAQGIYFVDRADPDRPQLAFFDLATGRSRIIAPLPRLLYKSGLTLSPDGRTLLYTQIDHNESDLMLVENWR